MPMQISTTTSPLFSATLRPERSLRVAGGWIGLVLAGIVGTPFLIAVPEFLLPGLAGFGLAGAGLVALTIRQSRAARRAEDILVWPDQVEIVIARKGEARQMRRFDPKRVRLVLQRDENERTTAMHLHTDSESIEIGAFMAIADKSSFARAFGQALRQARRA